MMRIAYLTGIPAISKTDSSSVGLLHFRFFPEPGYLTAMAGKKRLDHRLVQIGEPNVPPSVLATDVVWFDPRFVSPRPGLGVGVIISPSVEVFLRLKKNPAVHIVGVGAPEANGIARRLWFFKSIVDNKLFNPSYEYFLYGVPNPAELGFYEKLFSSFINSRITFAVCASCFVNSLYGCLYSRVQGVFYRPIDPKLDREQGDLGFLPYLKEDMDREQLRMFYKNQEIISEFADGLWADEWAEKQYNMLETTQGRKFYETNEHGFLPGLR